MKASESYGLSTIVCLCVVTFLLIIDGGLPDPAAKFYFVDVALLVTSIGLTGFSAFCFLLMIGYEG